MSEDLRRLAYRSAQRGRRRSVFRLPPPWDWYSKPLGPWVMAHFDCRTYEYHKEFKAALSSADEHLCEVYP